MAQPTNLDMSPKQAEHLLGAWLGVTVRCSGIIRLSGGMLNTVLRLEFDRDPRRAVVKLHTGADADFGCERRRLNYLRTHTAMRCPEVYEVGEPDDVMPYHFLLMESLPGITLAAAALDGDGRRSVDEQLAGIVLELHSHRRATFGPVDGPAATDDWADVVVPRLIDMRDEMQGRLPAAVLADIDGAIASAPAAFRGQGRPALVHGDLWAGNIMVAEIDGKWQVTGFIDPGLQFADVEHELAYLQCFDTVGPAFFDVYTAQTPMRPGYELRRLYYWLNTMMIHVWLFGDAAYCRRTGSIAATIARERGIAG